jgi:hypothetical protein
LTKLFHARHLFSPQKSSGSVGYRIAQGSGVLQVFRGIVRRKRLFFQILQF